jgi:hypothetical protein
MISALWSGPLNAPPAIGVAGAENAFPMAPTPDLCRDKRRPDKLG